LLLLLLLLAVGAGDCFTAAFMVGLLEGSSTAQAMQFAAGVASICVACAGAQPSLPSRQELEIFMRQQL
jgi:ribokinase